MPKQMEYTINSTRFGVRTQIGRYNTAVTYAMWGEARECQVVNSAGLLIPHDQIIQWLEAPGDGSKPS
jgi:hypothetical protein